MGTDTNIPWAQHTMNFWMGCTPVSEACAHCYAYREMRRYGRDPETVTRTSATCWRQPRRQGKRRWQAGDRVFVCSWSDFLHPAADAWRGEAWAVMYGRPDLIWLILTKRPERFAECLPEDWGPDGWPNVGLGVTVENQARANERIGRLLRTPAAVHFISYEPALGPVELEEWVPRYDFRPTYPYYREWLRIQGIESDGEPVKERDGVDWVIGGCESGPRRRASDIEWFRSLRGQCADAGVPFFLKQMDVGGRVVEMPELDGREHRAVPAAWRRTSIADCGLGIAE